MEAKKTPSKGTSRRISTEEFKRDAVNLVVVQGYSFKAAAEAVGVSAKSLRDWHDKFAPELWQPCAECYEFPRADSIDHGLRHRVPEP